VDVLVSFCYVSARNGRLKDFPNGIAMRVPLLPQLGTPNSDQYGYGHRYSSSPVAQLTTDVTYEKSFTARLDRLNAELIIELRKTSPVRAGDWIAVQSSALEGTIHYRVADASLFPTVRLDGEGVFLANHKSQTSTTTSQTQPAAPADVKGGYINVDVFLYDANFDDLPVAQKRNCVTMLLDTL
jgi:ubiquitin-conjugating enzyme E2 Q